MATLAISSISPIPKSTSKEIRRRRKTFKLVTENLRNLGALSIHDFLNNPETDLDIDYSLPESLSDERKTLTPKPEASTSREEDVLTPLQRLQDASEKAFRHANIFTFSSIEVEGDSRHQCVLTITRPNGISRSYRTPPTSNIDEDVKNEAASIAISLGALSFITSGVTVSPYTQPEPVKPETEALASTANTATHRKVKEIENCCAAWRPKGVKPEWFATTGDKHACALRIQLSEHSFRCYSSDGIYDTPSEAQSACAKIAIHDGVLEYIKHGNGQTEPSNEIFTPAPKSRPPVISLHSFYQALPQPLPESFDGKPFTEINSIAWLNIAIQAARGGRLAANYFWLKSDIGTHGCVLRVDRPNESKSYIVDPQFAKRAEAKAAVCFLAISQGIGNYIRAVGAAAENRITPAVRDFVNERVFPVILAEYYKVKPGIHPVFEYVKERDAFGSTMKLDVSSFSRLKDAGEYTSPPDYKTKADARIAVICVAAKDGAIELLRFRGLPPPFDYQPLLSQEATRLMDGNGKRKLDGVDAQLDSMEPRAKKQKQQQNSQGSSQSSDDWTPRKKRRRHKKPRRDRATSSDVVMHDIEHVGFTRDDNGGGIVAPPRSSSPIRYQDASVSNPPHMHPPPMYYQPPQNHGYIPYGQPGPSSSQLPYVMPSHPPPVPVPYYTNFPMAYPPPSMHGGPFMHDQYAGAFGSGFPGGFGMPSAVAVTAGHTSAGPMIPRTTYSLSSTSWDATARKVNRPRSASNSTITPSNHNRKCGTSSSANRTFGDWLTSTAPPASSVVSSSLSQVDQLTEFCKRENRPVPEFLHEVVRKGDVNMLNIWVEMGKERFELKKPFKSLKDGKEKLARRILSFICTS